MATTRLYLDDHALEATANVVAIAAGELALDRTCFYPGGGGQPSDHGTIVVDGRRLVVDGVRADASGVIWHACDCGADDALVGRGARLAVDPVRRLALSRYHTVLHVLNTLALRDHGALMTGTQIAVDYARIDFRIEGFTAALIGALEAKVNAVLSAAHPIRAYTMPEAEYAARGDLRRTLDAAPPVVDGAVRVVEIVGFDAQACGGTHVASTRDLGRFVIERGENKGRINKRLYVRLV